MVIQKIVREETTLKTSGECGKIILKQILQKICGDVD
jgi:hypothetical protein